MNSDKPRGAPSTLEAAPPRTAPPPQPEAPSTPTPNLPAQSGQVPPFPYPSPSTQPQRRPGQQARGRATWPVWVLGGALGALVLGGLVILLAALVGGLFVSTIAQNEQTTTSTRSFTVNGTPNLVIANTAGNVIVQSGGSGSQVVVQVTKHAWGSSVAVARNGLNAIPVTLSQSGNTITVTAQFTATYSDSGMARRGVDLLVTVPAAQANADLRVSAGNIDVRQFTGVIKADASAGNVTTENVTLTDGSRLHTSAGNITMDGAIANGATVDVTVGVGNATLTLPAATPAHLDAATSVGNLSIVGWSIPVSNTGVTGHHASGDLSPNPGAHLTAQVSTGNLTVRRR